MREMLAVSWEMPPLSGPRAVQVTRTLRELAVLGWRARVICFGPRSTRYNQDYDVRLEAETNGAVTRVKVPSPEEWFVFRALWRIVPPLKRLPDEKRIWVGSAVAAAGWDPSGPGGGVPPRAAQGAWTALRQCSGAG